MRLLVPFTLLFFVIVCGYGQSSGVGYQTRFIKNQEYEITLTNGTLVKGIFTQEEKDNITLIHQETQQEYEINKSQIKSVKHVLPSPEKLKDYRRCLSNYYFLAENALPYEKEKASFTSHYFLFTTASYAPNENWSVTSNILIVLPTSLGVKCSYKISDGLYFGAGAYVYFFRLNDSINSKNYFTFPLTGITARVTKGNSYRNFSFGGGIHGVKEEDSNGNYYMKNMKYMPIYSFYFALNHQFAKSFCLTAESRLFPQIYLNTTGAGIKYLRRQTEWNFCLYGIYLGKTIQLTKRSGIIFLPYVSYTIRV